MGPPLKAAENTQTDAHRQRRGAGFNGAAAKSSGKSLIGSLQSSPSPCFNGAAAKSSGKSRSMARRWTHRNASMGPPLKAAENVAPCATKSFRWRCFNGAAAKSSGKSTRQGGALPWRGGSFNGAAAKSSGKFRSRRRSRRRTPSFNGAAAKSSGKLRHAATIAARSSPGFNGAAAKSSGKSCVAPTTRTR